VSFLAAARLWLLVFPAGLLAVYFFTRRRVNSHAVRFTNLDLLDKVAPDRPGFRRHIPIALLTAAIALLAVAAARPVTTILVPSEQATVMLLIDTSISMDAGDVPPTRLDAAKESALDFIADVPEEVRIGLISFSGTVRLQSSPTRDRAETAAAIRSMELGEGTAIGDAIFEAMRVIDVDAQQLAEEGSLLVDGPPPATVLVLSDGVTTVGRPDQAAVDVAVERNIPVSTISFGTSAGSVTYQGERIPVPVNNEGLKAVAEQTGGEFFDADSAEDLQQVFDALGSQVGRVEESREVADLFGIAALVIASLAAAASLMWSSRIS